MSKEKEIATLLKRLNDAKTVQAERRKALGLVEQSAHALCLALAGAGRVRYVGVGQSCLEKLQLASAAAMKAIDEATQGRISRELELYSSAFEASNSADHELSSIEAQLDQLVDPLFATKLAEHQQRLSRDRENLATALRPHCSDDGEARALVAQCSRLKAAEFELSHALRWGPAGKAAWVLQSETLPG